jgi:sRNA-binding protein
LRLEEGALGGREMSSNVTKVKAIIAELVAAFPAAFTLDPALVRPVKLGIRNDLYAQSAISRRRITAALWSYCNKVHYLKASTPREDPSPPPPVRRHGGNCRPSTTG